MCLRRAEKWTSVSPWEKAREQCIFAAFPHGVISFHHGGAVQVDPMELKLKPLKTNRFKLNSDELV
jgi:hypothetical protein